MVQKAGYTDSVGTHRYLRYLTVLQGYVAATKLGERCPVLLDPIDDILAMSASVKRYARLSWGCQEESHLCVRCCPSQQTGESDVARS